MLLGNASLVRRLFKYNIIAKAKVPGPTNNYYSWTNQYVCTKVIHTLTLFHYACVPQRINMLLVLPSLPIHCTHIVAMCPDLGHSIDNGSVSYSRDPTEEGLYVENTTVTVSCDGGYRGGGDIICQNDGKWSSSSCTSKSSCIVNILCMTISFDICSCCVESQKPIIFNSFTLRVPIHALVQVVQIKYMYTRQGLFLDHLTLSHYQLQIESYIAKWVPAMY